MQDNNVPFVKTIARVTRDASGQLSEYKLPIEMPALLGASAEFIPITTLPMYPNGVINYDALPADTTLVGYIYGGISSTAKNVFFSNAVNASVASNGILKVFVIKSTAAVTDLQQLNPNSTGSLRLSVSPNPNNGKITVNYTLKEAADVTLQLFSENGREVYRQAFNSQSTGEHVFQKDILNLLGTGNFILQISTAYETARIKVLSDY